MAQTESKLHRASSATQTGVRVFSFPSTGETVSAVIKHTGGEYLITQGELTKLAADFPSLDIPAQLAKMSEWLLKRGNALTNGPKFIDNWLKRQRASAPKPPAPESRPAKTLLQQMREDWTRQQVAQFKANPMDVQALYDLMVAEQTGKIPMRNWPEEEAERNRRAALWTDFQKRLNQ
jgi:hypothetical protein